MQLSSAPDHTRYGPLIAVVGCDGSGKSTVTEAITRFAGRFGEVEAVHLGKQAGNVARALARLPLVGGGLDRKIETHAARARNTRGRANPHLLAALVAFGFTLRRRRRFDRMMRRWRPRTIIVADRFPQAQIVGAADGPMLHPDDPRASGLVRWLARRERRHFATMTRIRPDLVIRLNVDVPTALARKPDHKLDVIERKVAANRLFTFGGAPIVDLDSHRPLAEVVAAATAAVAETLARLGYGARGNPVPAAAQLSSAASPSSLAASP